MENDPPQSIYPNQLNRLKGVEKLHCLISPIFSESSLKEWRKPFDFPTGISGFPMLMVSIPTTDIQIWVGGVGGGGNPDPEIRGTPALQKKKISALRASVWCKNKGGRGLVP